MVSSFSPKVKILLVFGLFAFVTLSIFGLGHMSGMIESENGDMAGCIFTGKTMLCKMNIIEHISSWQSLFTTTLQKSFITILTLPMLLMVFIFIAKNILPPPQKFYLIQHPDLLLFTPLKEAFSQGILNPKIYDLAGL